MPGSPIQVTATLDSLSSLDCADETLTMSNVTMPEGWSVDFGNMPVAVKSGGELTYTFMILPPASASVGSYSLQFALENSKGKSTDSLSVYLSLTPPVNKAPVALTHNITISTISPVVIPVLANDYDPEGGPISIIAVGKPTYGTASLNSDGTITYSPSRRLKSSDAFSYTISDGKLSATATVKITLSGSTSGGGGKGGGQR